jgi:hypothetical protein
MAYSITLTDILNQWEIFGVFNYILPFLVIFAVVYGILAKTKLLGENKGVNAAISLAIGLLSLQYDYVSLFFKSLFPYAGMGIGVLLLALILMGLISSDKDAKWANKIWFAIGIIIFLVVVLAALSDMDWFLGNGYIWGEAWPSIVALIVLGAVVSFIIWGGGSKSSSG